MVGIRIASLIPAVFFVKPNGALPFLGRYIAFIMVGDLVNFNLYYPESREICEVHQSLKRQAELEDIK
jgi:hypothetical protein